MNPQPMIDYLHAATDEAIRTTPHGYFPLGTTPHSYWAWRDTDRIDRVVRVLEERYGLDRWSTYGRTRPTKRSYLRPEER